MRRISPFKASFKASLKAPFKVVSKTLFAATVLVSFSAMAAPVRYTVDASHTYPSFEAPHIGGISFWRGKIEKSSGSISLDREAKAGSIDIVMDMTTIDFGHDKMNEHAKKPDIFDVAQFPTATYKSTKLKFDGETPVAVEGELTMHGVTKVVPLTIKSFKCIPHPFLKVEVCGADVVGELDRTEFGVGYGVGKSIPTGMVKLAIQVEALRDAPAGPPS